MTKPKVCLITAHAPSIGGGSAILRSLVAELANTFDISWHYLAMRPDEDGRGSWLGRPIIGVGNPGLDMLRTGLIFAGWQSSKWRELLEKVLAIDCDAYWIVSHGEGLCLARDLARSTSRPIHLTVHDDWAGALCARSRRHRPIKALAASVTIKALKAVCSVDVVSAGMRNHYLMEADVEPSVVHRFMPWFELPEKGSRSADISVGHLGSIYCKQDFFVFLEALKLLCDEMSVSPRVVLWGSFKASQLPTSIPSFVEINPTTEEEKIILELQKCRFVYASYPFTSDVGCFVRTSLPTKLSTYVAARRPILGHAPQDSTLASFIGQTGVGVLWSSLDKSDGRRAISDITNLNTSERDWRKARDLFFGEANVRTMERCLANLVGLRVR